MRVIAGEARGRSLEALPGTDVTRPTLSQVKEAMFSIVQFDLPGARVLDLYAGSGQLGIEALSRGAARCVFLDENREAVNIIMRNCKACGVFDRSRVNIGEAARYLSACREQFDIVLLDPPFRNGTLEKILPAVDKCTAPGGIVLCESETGIVLPAEAGGLTLKKQYKYGRVLLWKYTKPMQNTDPAENEPKGEALGTCTNFWMPLRMHWRKVPMCPFPAAKRSWMWSRSGIIWTRSVQTCPASCGRPSRS